ncbi:MAG: NepR family anti-sigma factor [Methylocella sp.]
MSNGDDRSRGEPVTKSTKSSAALIRTATIRSSEECETKDEGIGLNEFAEGVIVSASRSRKCAGRADVVDQIGLGLRSVYDDVLSQPVPDRFFDLLRRLERVGGPQLKKDAP